MDARSFMDAAQTVSCPDEHRATPAEKNNRPVLNRFLNSFLSRWQAMLSVVDDAFQSEHMKDRIWAAEQILKRFKPDLELLFPATKESLESTPSPLTAQQIEHMSDDELQRAIDALLDVSEPSSS